MYQFSLRHSLRWVRDSAPKVETVHPGADLGLLKGGWPMAKPESYRGPGASPRTFFSSWVSEVQGISSILRAIFDNTFEHSAVEKDYILGLELF